MTILIVLVYINYWVPRGSSDPQEPVKLTWHEP